MRIKLALAALAVLGLAAFCTPAMAAGDTGVYIAPRLSYSLSHLSNMRGKGFNANQQLDSGYNHSFGVSLAAGYDIFTNYSVPVRVEAEVYYLGQSKENGSTSNLFGGGDFPYSQTNSVKGMFLNGYFDLHNSTIFTPYAGGGVGPSWVTSKGSVNGFDAPANTETSLAWNLGVGVGVELNYNASVDFGYRYSRYGNARTGVTQAGHYLDSTMGTHQLMLGLRYAF